MVLDGVPQQIAQHSLQRHTLRRLLEAGLLVTINSDDPAYFGGYLSENYRQVVEALALSPAQVVALAANSFRASFLDAPAKRRHAADIAAVARAHGVSLA